MSTVRIKPDQLEREVKRTLEDYGKSVSLKVKEAVDEGGKEAVKKLKATSPRRAKNSKGYWKSWRKRATKETADDKEVTVYSSQPGLPHLLEHGHATRNGGRTKPIVHIAPVEEEVAASVEREIVRELSDG